MQATDLPADTAPAMLGGPPLRPGPPPRRLHRRLGPVAGALLLALLALAAQWLALDWIGARLPFIFILPAVVLAAALWGREAGTAVLALCMLGSVPLLGRPLVGAMPGGPVLLPLLLLGAVGGLLVELGARLRQLRQRARAAEARLMLAIEGTGMGVFEVDLAARQVHLSPGLARHLGLPAGPVPLARWLDSLPAPVLQAARARLTAQTAARSASDEQILHLPAADADVGAGAAPEWLLLRMQVDWRGDSPTQLRGVCLDITARKQAEDARDAARAALQQQVDDLGMLHQLSSRLLEVDRLDLQLGVILQALARTHGAAGGLVAVLAADGSRLDAAAASGLDEATAAEVLAAVSAPQARMLARQPVAGDRAHDRMGDRMGDRVADRVADRVVLPDTDAPDTPAPWRALAQKLGVRAVHATPLVSRDGVLLGAVVLLLPQPGRPGERECRLADLCARKAAVFVERARAQAALAAEKDRFQAVLESSAVPFAVLSPLRDAHGTVTDFRWRFVNGAAARALGRPPAGPGGLQGRRVQRDLLARSGGRHDLQPYIDVIEQGQARQQELQLHLGGRDGWVHCIASPVQGEVAVWFNDITDRKRDEALAREAARRKDEFLAMLAHELRNPLAPIRQAARLLREPAVDPARASWCHAVIERQVAHMAALLDDLLDVSRITRGMLVLRRAPAWLQGVVDMAVETAQPLIDARGHALVLDLPDTPVALDVDALRLSQVLGNLLVNGARYTRHGGRIVLQARAGADGLVLDVIDNGIGIPADALGRVFEMFSQLAPGDESGAGGQGQGGLGIGLALSRALIELHGGRITAHSDGPGRGSCFRVQLPASVLRSSGEESTMQDNEHGHGAGTGRPQPATTPDATADGPALRMLVADDNRDAAGSLAMLLQVHGYTVHQAFDGEQALALFERVTPQVCLLDIGMPRRDGYSVARAIRRMAGPQPVLVAVTGWGQAHDRQRALDAGFDHHLTKPVGIDQLLQLVGRVPAR